MNRAMKARAIQTPVRSERARGPAIFPVDQGLHFPSSTFVPVDAPAAVRAAFEAAARRNVDTRGGAPTVVVRQEPADNDAIWDHPARNRDAVERWAQHALAANGFGGFGNVAIGSTRLSTRPTRYERYHAARVHRAIALGSIIVEVIQAVVAIARRAYARHLQRREARETRDALAFLDDRALRDLGLDRSEITSIAAEIAGEAQYTRMRALQTLPSLQV